MRKPKLVSTGCSFSDYTGKSVTRTYGEIFAEKLGCEYLHLAKGGSGNQRIFRLVTENIMSGNIAKGDLVLVQFAEPARAEIPIPLSINLTDQVYEYPVAIDTVFGKYPSLDWKPGLEDDFDCFRKIHKSASIILDRFQQFLKTYEEIVSLNEFYCLNQIRINNIMLEALCEKHGVRLLYIWHTTMGLWADRKDKFMSERYIETIYNEYIEITKTGKDGHADKSLFLGYDIVNGIKHENEFDSCHFSQKGHHWLADQLYIHYKKVEHKL